MSDEEKINKQAIKCEMLPFSLSGVMKGLSELECEIWDNSVQINKIKMQHIIIFLKSELIRIDKENRDIITVNGLKYRRVYE